ncbi:hypothetical protein [Micromonospora viridifaciens]|uniref:hypothetical protein n=1 Tax=Micromonospora viridifaciens TaxID=1881 RepID=UPI0012FD955D|nr:hypothetical protein [Micromonospora viridifaciens]
MSPARAGESARHLRLPPAERAAVALLSRLLPAGFRARQRDEWTADLLSFTSGAGTRWRYLAGAAWTLPALRRAARRGGFADLSTVAPAPGVLASMAHLFLLGLGWPVVSWLIMVPVTYLAADIPGRLALTGGPVDPKSLWPTDGPLVVLLPLQLLLHLGASAVILGGPFLLGTFGASGLVSAVAQRRRSGRYRLVIAGVGLAFLALTVVAGLAWSYGAFYPDALGLDSGRTAAVLGAAAGILALAGRRLGARIRTALAALGVLAITVPFVHLTTTGAAMLNWYLD